MGLQWHHVGYTISSSSTIPHNMCRSGVRLQQTGGVALQLSATQHVPLVSYNCYAVCMQDQMGNSDLTCEPDNRQPGLAHGGEGRGIAELT